MVSTDSAQRRKSIAVVSSFAEASPARKHKRRAHSIAPGDRLAHLAKIRRTLVPRKSILKSASARQSLSLDSPSSSANVSASMDITQTHSGPRKSLGGRVSFARVVSVRVINGKNQRERSVSSVPDSDPPSPIEEPELEEQAEDQSPLPPAAQADENDYPGASKRSRRRSSARVSFGNAESSPMGSNLLDEILSDDETNPNEDDDMDLSDSPDVRRQLLKRHSLMPPNQERAPLSTLPTPTPQEEEEEGSEVANLDLSSEADISIAYSSDPPVEYEHPISKPLRPSLAAKDDPIYQQLLAVAGGSQSSVDPDESGNSLNEAYDAQPADDSLISLSDTDNSGLNFESGDHTMNMSAVLGRASVGTSLQDDSMDISSVYVDHTWAAQRDAKGKVRLSTAVSVEDEGTSDGNDLHHLTRRSGLGEEQTMGITQLLSRGLQDNTVHTTSSAMDLTNVRTTQFAIEPDEPPTSPEPSSSPPRPIQPPPQAPSVFSLPNEIPTQPLSLPKDKDNSRPNPFSRPPTAPALRIQSPVKPKPKPSAAFAPPTARPSPKKFAVSAAPSPISPRKRPHPLDGHEAIRPSPLKKQARGPSPVKQPAVFSAASRTTAADPPANKRLSARFSMRRKSLATADSSLPKGPATSSKEIPPIKPVFEQASLPVQTPDVPQTEVFNLPLAQAASSPRVEEKKVASRRSLLPARRVSFAPQKTFTPPLEHPPLFESHHTLDETVEEAQELDNVPSEREESGGVNMETDGSISAPGASTQRWLQGVQDVPAEDADTPSIGIQHFMEMTEIRFMDELSAPRRSSIHPADSTIRRRRSMASSIDIEGDKSEIPLEEYIISMAIDVPRLSLYNRVTDDLTSWIEISKKEMLQAEEDAAQVTPELFKEYIMADDEGRDEIKQQLLLTRTHKRYVAKSEWYKWKLQWVEHLYDELESAYKVLEQDNRFITEIEAELDQVLPQLEQEYDEVKVELEREQAEVAEIENCDQAYLKELKATIADENVIVESLRAEVSENVSKLEWLSKRLHDAEEEKERHVSYIRECRRALDVRESSTREEINRLDAHLRTLLDLHMMQKFSWSENFIQFDYAYSFTTKIKLKNAIPFIGGTIITPLANTGRKDAFPHLSRYFMDLLESHLNSRSMSFADVLHTIASTWSRCERIRNQLNFIPIKFPLSITTSQDGIQAKVMVYFPKAQSKANIVFHISTKDILSWPKLINELHWETQVVYGSASSSTINQAIRARLDQATPGDCHGCLFDACVEAFDIYG